MNEGRGVGRPDELQATIGAAPGTSGGSGDGDLVGTILAGRYRIVRKLGEGAMGAVYLGQHLKIGREDAIKVLRTNLATEPEAVARFLRGTRNVSMIRHPNICTLYDFSDMESGAQFVAMEFVPGDTLKDVLQREGVLPLGRALHIAKQVADALHAAHEAGIVHRDLKPANIMVVPGRKGDHIKVVDFDIAKGPADGEGEEVTRHGFVVGTPEYMSPEQLIGERLDGRSDIYSLALVIYRMLTGTLPFRSEGVQDLMIKRLTDTPLRLSEGHPGGTFPEALERALQRALQRKPADRQRDAEEFGMELVAAMDAHPAPFADPVRPIGDISNAPGSLPATQIGLSPPTGTPGAVLSQPGTALPAPARSKRTALIAGGAVALVAAAAVVISILPDREVDTPPDSALVQDPVSDPGSGEVVVNPPSDPGSITPLSSRVEPGPTAPPTTTTTTTTGQPAVNVPSVQPTVSAAVPPGQMDAVLDRLFERVGPPYPSAAVLGAIRDTAILVSNSAGASTAQQAYGAYLAGSALLGLNQREEALRWLDRAVTLNPGARAYSTLRDLNR